MRWPWRPAPPDLSLGPGSALLLLALLIVVSCREHGHHPALRSATPAVATSGGAPAPGDAGKLPEDAEAGARSVAEWRQHLEREELERRLSFDRRKLAEHQAVLKTLRHARRSFDAAVSERAVLAAERRFEATAPLLEKRFEVIDPHGDSSKVVPDYRLLVATFSGPYPRARQSALSGDAAELTRLGEEVDARFRTIDAWLREAAESEDE